MTSKLDELEEVDVAETEVPGVGRTRRIIPASGRGRAILVVILIVLLGGGVGGFLWYQQNTLPDDAAFRVGDEVVTIDQLNGKVDTLRALYGVQVPREPDKLAAFRKDSAKAAAMSLILDRAAADNNVVIADKTARDTLSKFIAQQLGEGPQAREKFIEALGSAGTNEQAVLTEIKRQLAVNQLFNKITEGASVTDKEVVDAFAERREQLATPERRQIANIVVSSREQADQLVSRLRGGTDFATLAQQRSLDSSTKNEGGSLGELSQSQLEKDYGSTAFDAKPGAVFGPVRNQFGWNVGKVVRIVPSVPADFSQVEDQLKEQLTLEKATATWRAWLSDQIRAADVRYADDYRPADPDAVPPTGAGVPGESEAEEEPPR